MREATTSASPAPAIARVPDNIPTCNKVTGYVFIAPNLRPTAPRVNARSAAKNGCPSYCLVIVIAVLSDLPSGPTARIRSVLTPRFTRTFNCQFVVPLAVRAGPMPATR